MLILILITDPESLIVESEDPRISDSG